MNGTKNLEFVSRMVVDHSPSLLEGSNMDSSAALILSLLITKKVHCSKSLTYYRSYIGRIWTDSLVHDQDALELLVKKIGIDRIMLGRY